MTEKIRWGILGTGRIAGAFAQGLKFLPDANLKAVGSRTHAAADHFGNLYDIPRRHASYEALAADPDIDVVYIATPHTLHHDNTILCLEAGKAVLCEKPFAINKTQSENMIAVARRKGLFLMEAMWTRYIPAVIELQKLLSLDVIGDIRMMEANIGFCAKYDPSNRFFNPELGGGSLLDIGVYPIALSYLLLGPPARITAMADIGRTGVDERASVTFGYPEGRLAVLNFSVTTDMTNDAVIFGTKGWIRIHSPVHRPHRLTVTKKVIPDAALSRLPEIVKRLSRIPVLTPIKNLLMSRREGSLIFPIKGNGYNYEAAEVMGCLRKGKLESARMTLDETRSIIDTMDQIRALWGLKYPCEH
ncbi:MAG: dehydrogenase [Syntrophus sp. (in: bacteria)]|nr:dehydrogenase [Syntrophus sp. (in: bacteria)]